MIRYHIVHELPGRMRVRYGKYAFDGHRALGIQLVLNNWEEVDNVEVNYVTGSVLFNYKEDQRDQLLTKLDLFDACGFDLAPIEDQINDNAYTLKQKQTNVLYTDKVFGIIIRRLITRFILPNPLSRIVTLYNAFKFVKKGINSLGHGRIDVPVLDATSIVVSMINGDFNTAGNIMMLLNISDTLEDYTKKKTSLQLEESLSLNIDKVWVYQDGTEVEIPSVQLKKGDIVVARTGGMIPVDGEVTDGEAMINEASFTGEPLSKPVKKGDSVLAGTVVDEGRIYIKVRTITKESRIAKIVSLINTNEDLKADIQANAEHLADSIVPFSFIAFFGMLAITRSLTRASSVLLVDYSCAIRLSTSIAVISAMSEASTHSIMVKGGKYIEAMANADTIVFDKTGTLTNATPVVQNVISLGDYDRDQVLRLSACIEEHFPHSMANAIVNEAKKEGLMHTREMHAKVNYIIAHGISTEVNGKKAVIGSSHFIFEDEKVEKTPETEKIIHDLHQQGANSLIFLAVDGKLEGIISIHDPLKKESADVIKELRKVGFKQIVMMTGDSEHSARNIASQLNLDRYYAQVLPEDKANYVKELQDEGHNVVMVGDGVNDTPALSQANVSISMQNSSDIARELADITLTSSDLRQIVEFKKLSTRCIANIHKRYGRIVTFNTTLIILGIVGVLQPSTSALLHNTSTFVFSAEATRKLL